MEFNIDPYYDDFKANALDNNYVRVLFKPGYAVQARELTQIQSILQNQIKQFGNHIFQNGSPVIGGNMTFDNKVKYLKLETTYNNYDVNVDDFIGKVIRSSNGKTQAKVLTTYYPTGGTPTLLVKYLTGAEFSDGSVITIATTTTQAKLVSTNSTGLATVCSINEGVFYVDGFFVKVLDQTTSVNPYGTTANVKVGLQITEDIVDSVVDTTLLDPAQGSFNYQAPGADRYQFNLTLSTRPLDTIVDESKFFELMRIESGVITKQVKYPVYAELEKSLARRTYEQAGDFTVAPFRASLVDGVDTNNYSVAIEPGKAYVKGFEFETLGTVKIEAPKPRSESDTKSYVDIDVDTSYGNYVYVTSLRGSGNGFINIAALEKIDIHCVDTSKVPVALGTTANVQIYANTKIGTARIKSFSRYSTDQFNVNTDSNGVFKLYLSDLSIEPKITKVSAASSNANTIRLSDKFSSVDNAYQNVIVTVLPIKLDAVANINVANVFVNSYTLNSNSAVANSCNVLAAGDIIRVGDMVRQVVSINVDGSGNANTLTVNTAWTQTIVGTNKDSNPLGVYKQTSYTQNVSNQFRNVERYNAATQTIFLDSPFDNGGIPDGDTVIQLNYGLDDADSFIAGPAVDANNLIAPIANASMNVSSVSRLVDGSTYAADATNSKLIFKLPGNYVANNSLKNVDYFYNKLIQNRGNTGTPGQFTVGVGQGLQTFERIAFADSTSAIQQNLIVIVRDNAANGISGNTSFPNGSILQLTSANISIAGSTSITIDTNIGDINKVDIIINVKENDVQNFIRTKTLKSNTSPSLGPFTYPTSNASADVTVSLPNLGEVAKINVQSGFIWLTNPTYNSISQGDRISLFCPDVIRVRKILAGSSTAVPNESNYTDVTQHFGLHSGQYDDVYDHAYLELLPGYDAINAMLLVHVDMFQHNYASGSNVSYFSVDSYETSIYGSGQIPIYKSSSGDTFYLRDCLDFRPTRPIGDTSYALKVPYIPSPDSTTELSFKNYLPRIDKLVLSKDKEFRVIQGKSAARPIPPNDIDDAMTLFQINLPPYVADIREAKLKYFDNRRFTMKDISKISKKVDQLSYYVSLNNAENQALADPTQYEDGTDKAKYGTVGENFTNFNIADYRNKDFNAALENGLMVPSSRSLVSGLKEIGSTTTSQNMKTVSLQYTETPAIVQGVASDKAVSIQPFLFGSFNGTVELYPDTDYWKSEVLKPEVIAPPETIITQINYVTEITHVTQITEKEIIRERIIENPPPPYVPPPAIIPPVIVIPNVDPPAPTVEQIVPQPPTDYVDPGPAVIVPVLVEPSPPPPEEHEQLPPPPPPPIPYEDPPYVNDPEQPPLPFDIEIPICVYPPPPIEPIIYVDPWVPPPEPPPPPPPPEPVTPPTVSPPVYVGGGGGSTGCPDPSMLLLLADETWIAAGDLEVGMMVKTQHENTLDWGNFEVIYKEIITQPKLEIVFSNSDKKVIVSESHRFWVESKTAWINSKDLEAGDIINGSVFEKSNKLGDGPVVKITIDEAHTYIMEGFLSHNMKMMADEINDNLVW